MLLGDALGLTTMADRPAVVAFVGAGGKSSALFQLADELVAAGQRVVTTTTTRVAAAQIRRAPGQLLLGAAVLDIAELRAQLDRHRHCMIIGRETIDQGPIHKKAGIPPTLVDELAAHAQTLNIAAILVEADGSRMLPAKAPGDHEPALPGSTTLLVPVIGCDAVGLPIMDGVLHRPDRIRALLGFTAGEPAPRLTPAAAARLLIDPASGIKSKPPGAAVVTLVNKVDTPLRLAVGRLIAGAVNRTGYPCLLTTLHDGAVPVRERWAPWAAVVLAAGGSRRMGTPKQLALLGGEALVVRAVRTALATDAATVLVVTGAAADDVARALAPLSAGAPGRVRLVHNPHWSEGQAGSVKSALAAATGVDALLFMPVDQPLLDAALLLRLVRGWQLGAPVVAPAVDGVLRGAPCLFARSLWPELAQLQGDVGGRPVLRRHAAVALAVDVAADLLRDVDTPAQLADLQSSPG